MTVYYNEFDPKAAAWLRQLIKNGNIAPVAEEFIRAFMEINNDTKPKPMSFI